jgi:hypothetical protein
LWKPVVNEAKVAPRGEQAIRDNCTPTRSKDVGQDYVSAGGVNAAGH